MTILMAIVFLSFALFLCWVAIRCVKNEKWGYLSLLVPCITVLSIAWHPSMVGFIKTELVQILGKKTADLGTKLDDVLKTITDVQNNIDSQQKELSHTQETLTEQERKLKEQQGEINIAHEELQRAYVRLDEHQKRIANIDQLTKNIFKQFRTEKFRYPDQNRLFISHKKDATKDAIVVFKLDQIPIKETIELQWYHTRQSPTAFITIDNFVLVNWADSISKVIDKWWVIKYIADPISEKEPGEFTVTDGKCRFKNIEIEELTMRVDGARVNTFFDRRDKEKGKKE